MIKKEKISKDNIVKFPTKLTDLEKEIEAVIFAAAEPLDVDTIESKVTKKGNISKSDNLDGNLTILSFEIFSFLIIIFLNINIIK